MELKLETDVRGKWEGTVLLDPDRHESIYAVQNKGATGGFLKHCRRRAPRFLQVLFNDVL